MKRITRRLMVRKTKRCVKRCLSFLEALRIYADIPIGYNLYRK